MAIFLTAPGHRPAIKNDVYDVNAKLVRTEDRIGELQNEIDRLLLVTESMWFVLKDKFGLDDAVLMAMINEVDMMDGKLDGKAGKMPAACSKCGHAVSVRKGKGRGRCLYCGTWSEKKTPF